MNKLDKLGKLISEDLRDSALSRYLDIESGSLRSKKAMGLNKELSSFSEEQKEIVRKILTNSIDAGIHDFLFALEEGQSEVRVMVEGEDMADLSDGLQGEIFTEDGWFEKYSRYKESGI